MIVLPGPVGLRRVHVMKSVVVVRLATEPATGAVDVGAPFLVMGRELHRDGVYHDEPNVIAQFLPGESKASFYAEWSENGWTFGKRVPEFVLIGKWRGGAGQLRIIYGEGGNDDPLPFILSLTPEHVARQTGKSLPLTLEQLEEYADQNAEYLRAVAKHVRYRDWNSHVLG